MSHFVVAVILPKPDEDDDEDISRDEQVAHALAHFEEDKHDLDAKAEGGGLLYGPKWDWYVIGGRWTGWAMNIDPESIPENWETCELCKGTGKRTDQVGQQLRNADPTFGCNGCKGGRKLKWSSNLKDVGNVLPVKTLVENGKVPFAIVTPDRVWHEEGDMGWFGLVSDRKDKATWEAEVKKLLEPYAEETCVIVDCHV